MTLLFITQKLHGQDAFAALWVQAFIARGYTVKVLCLESRPDLITQALGTSAGPTLDIYSMGKECGVGRLRQVLLFWKHICTLEYDRVFIHMSPVWGLLGAWWWIPWGTPVYLWYTHYKMQAGLWLLHLYAKRLFCATPQSMPQYERSSKKVVTGHGIDLAYWSLRPNVCVDGSRLLGVYRLSRSKRVEIILRALTLLPDYTFDLYGIEAEPGYVAALQSMAASLKIADRVRFLGTALSRDLPAIYVRYRLILNMASETIDKTMLEAMTCGCYPVTTAANARAIGITAAPAADTPEAIARFILEYTDHLPVSPREMYRIVAERHSLEGLMQKMDAYIVPGM